MEINHEHSNDTNGGVIPRTDGLVFPVTAQVTPADVS